MMALLTSPENRGSTPRKPESQAAPLAELNGVSEHSSSKPPDINILRRHTLTSEHDELIESAREFTIQQFMEGRDKGTLSPRRRRVLGLATELSVRTEARLQEVFTKYASFEADKGRLSGMGDRGKTVDFHEFLACLGDLGLLKTERHEADSLKPEPHALAVDKTFVAELFTAINQSAKEEGKHEFSFADFQVAMCTISVALRSVLEDIIFPHSISAAVERLPSQQKQTEADMKIEGLSEMKQEHMAALRVIFEEHGGDMDMKDFREVFGPLLGMADDEVNTMFMRIDADTDGAISWDEFANYVIALGNPMIDRDADVVLSEQVISDSERAFDHDSTIEVAAFCASNRWRPEGDKYVTCTQDGAIRLWYGSSGNAIKHDVVLQGPSSYVHCMCAMERYNMCVVCSNDERIRFFSFEPRFRLEIEYKTTDCQAMACCSFAFLQGKEWTSYFVWGDDRGRLHFVMEDDIMAGRKSGGAVGYLDAEALRKSNPSHNFTPKAFFSGWVTKVDFVPGLSLAGLVVAAGNDGSLVTYDPDQRAIVTRFCGHSLAVKTFCWCQASKCVSSGGLDRDILMWDPKTGRKIGRLLGHKAAVKDMAYYARNDTLFSLDFRFTIFIWDLGKQVHLKMLKTDTDGPQKLREATRAGQLLVNERRGLFGICSRHPKLWRIRNTDTGGGGGSRHQHPLVAALYNAAFHQLVTVDKHGLVCVWEMTTGEQHFKFYVNTKAEDGLHFDPTCASFDNMHRKLLVGFSNGIVHSYNFNNGVQRNTFLTKSQSAIVSVCMSPADGRGSRELKSLVFAIGLESSIYYWKGTGQTFGATVLPQRKMHLPPWRKDWGVDMVSMSYHRSAKKGCERREGWRVTAARAGMIATGRRDGQVLLWNVMTGFFKKDLDSSLFRKMDLDHTGSLDYKEVAEFLRVREKYSEQEIKDFFERADVDGGGTISKEEFIQAVQSRGTLERLDPQTGKAVYARREYYVEAVHFMRRTELLLCAFADGWVSFMDWNAGSDVVSLSVLPPDNQHALVTCVETDDQEEVLFVADSYGRISVWDIRTVLLSHRPSKHPMQVEKVAGWQAHEGGGVVSLEWIKRGMMLLSCGGGPEGEACIWTSEGDLLGSIGRDAPWSVPSDEQEKMLLVLKNAAETKQMELAQPPAAHRANEDGLADLPRTTPAMEKKESSRMAKFRNEKVALKSAAKVVLNRNWMRLQVVREEELKKRMERVDWFFHLHLPYDKELTQRLREGMEDVWWEKLNLMSYEELRQGPRTRLRRLPNWEDLHGEQRVRSLVQDFSTSVKDLSLPPDKSLVAAAHKYILDRLKPRAPPYSPSSRGFTPLREISGGSMSRGASSAGSPSVGDRAMSMGSDSWRPWSRGEGAQEEALEEATVRGYLTIEIVQRRVEAGRESEAGSEVSEDEREADEANAKFEASHGWHPSFEGVVSRQQRRRCAVVTSAVREILGEKKGGAAGALVVGRRGGSRGQSREGERGSKGPAPAPADAKARVSSVPAPGAVPKLIGPLTARRLSSRHLNIEMKRRWDGELVQKAPPKPGSSSGSRKRPGSRGLQASAEGVSWTHLYVHNVAPVAGDGEVQEQVLEGAARAASLARAHARPRVSAAEQEAPATARGRLEGVQGSAPRLETVDMSGAPAAASSPVREASSGTTGRPRSRGGKWVRASGDKEALPSLAAPPPTLSGLAALLDKSLLLPPPSPPQLRPQSNRSSLSSAQQARLRRRRGSMLAAQAVFALSPRSSSPPVSPRSPSPTQRHTLQDAGPDFPKTPPLPSVLRARRQSQEGPVTPLSALRSEAARHPPPDDLPQPHADKAASPAWAKAPARAEAEGGSTVSAAAAAVRAPDRAPAFSSPMHSAPHKPPPTPAPAPAQPQPPRSKKQDQWEAAVHPRLNQSSQVAAGRTWRSPFADPVSRVPSSSLPPTAAAAAAAQPLSIPLEPAMRLLSQLWCGVGDDLESVAWRESLICLQGAALLATPTSQSARGSDAQAEVICMVDSASHVAALSDVFSARVRPNALQLTFIPPPPTTDAASPVPPPARSFSQPPHKSSSTQLFLAAKGWKEALRWVQALTNLIDDLRKERRKQAEARLRQSEGNKERMLLMRCISKAEARPGRRPAQSESGAATPTTPTEEGSMLHLAGGDEASLQAQGKHLGDD